MSKELNLNKVKQNVKGALTVSQNGMNQKIIIENQAFTGTTDHVLQTAISLGELYYLKDRNMHPNEAQSMVKGLRLKDFEFNGCTFNNCGFG